MNVIVSNERKNELCNLNIDIIKTLDGEYSVEDLIGIFTNFFFNKMILDITSIKDYTNYSNLKKLFESVEASKIIVYLNDLTNTKEFKSDLITLGVYNFTNDYNSIMDLFRNPKSYDDVKDMQISKSTFDVNKEIDESLGVNQKEDYVFLEADKEKYNGEKRVIGVVDLTSHAGATTLVVQMVKQLNVFYKSIGIEINKQDFVYYNTPFIYSCMSKIEVVRKISEHKDIDAVIVDLNEFNDQDFCTDIIYLIEPGKIKMGKLMNKNSNIFKELSGEKLVLNRTNMDDNQVREFECETNTKIFSVVTNFRDSIDRVMSVDKLLFNLGFSKCNPDVNKGGLFRKFK